MAIRAPDGANNNKLYNCNETYHPALPTSIKPTVCEAADLNISGTKYKRSLAYLVAQLDERAKSSQQAL